MEPIIKRLIENHRVDEMAYERSDAIDRCASLGKRFIEHFIKAYLEGNSSDDFKHHCQEMQSWFDEVSSIVLKSNKKVISNNQLIDWFFTRGSSVDLLFDDEDMIDIYNEFMIELLSSKRTKRVVDILEELIVYHNQI